MSTIETVQSKRAQRKAPKAVRDALSVAVGAVVDRYGGRQIPAAKALGVHQSAISLIVSQQREPRLVTLLALRNELGKPLDEILGLDPIGAQNDGPAADAELARLAGSLAAELDRRAAAKPHPAEPAIEATRSARPKPTSVATAASRPRAAR